MACLVRAILIEHQTKYRRRVNLSILFLKGNGHFDKIK